MVNPLHESCLQDNRTPVFVYWEVSSKMNTTGSDQADASTIATDFQESVKGELADESVDAAVTALLATTTSFPAHGSVASMIFYLKFGVTVDGGKKFDGNAGGISTPGGGALIGDVYTDNLDRLYNETRSFYFTATPVYTALVFFDSSHRVLGHFQAGAVSVVAGTGGGSGHWS